MINRKSMNKVFNILYDISIFIVLMSFWYIIMNYSSIITYTSAMFQDTKEINEIKVEETVDDTFLLFDNSDKVHNSIENRNYVWTETINFIDYELEKLILVNSENNNTKEINAKLEERRKEIKKEKVINLWNSKSFENLSSPLTQDEKDKYWENSYIVIPSIWVEAPIFYPSIEEKNLENHILDLLEKWVVHRPETQKPNQEWNFFILWHSSNVAWVESEYSNIFAKLDLMNLTDRAYVYYKWRKYTYELNEKQVVPPTAIEVYWFIPWHNLSIMTCYPIWSVSSRLIWKFSLIKN